MKWLWVKALLLLENEWAKPFTFAAGAAVEDHTTLGKKDAQPVASASHQGYVVTRGRLKD